MKKALLILTCCLMAVVMHAQTKHLKFMGIPLNGTITQFQSKLVAKGLTPATKFNQTSPVGSRMFKGTFAGERADFFTYYNAKTKIVYRAKAVTHYSDINSVTNKLKEYKNMLIEKYPYHVMDDSEYNGRPAFALYVNDEDGYYLGCIALYIDLYNYEYDLHIDYEDGINSDLNTSKNMDDL